MKTWIASLLMVTSLSASAATRQEIIDNVAVNIITQTYIDLANATANLKNKVDVLVQAPTEENLAAAQQAWREARVPWECSEAFLFGPVESLGLDPMLDTWPLNKLDLDGVLNSSRPLTVDFVRGLGTNLQGFHTLEYLLFGDGVHAPTKPAVSLTPRQLQYLQSAAILLAEYAGRLSHAWTTNHDPEIPEAPGYGQIIRTPGFRNRYYTSERAVFEEYIRGMMGIADEVGSGKMSDPMGADIGSANTTLVESPFAWNSLNDFSNNINSILHVYTGTYGAHQGPGIKNLVAEFDPALAQRVEDKILKSVQLIKDIAGPNNIDFRQAILVADGRQRTEAAIASLVDLHTTLEKEVLPLLDR